MSATYTISVEEIDEAISDADSASLDPDALSVDDLIDYANSVGTTSYLAQVLLDRLQRVLAVAYE